MSEPVQVTVASSTPPTRAEVRRAQFNLKNTYWSDNGQRNDLHKRLLALDLVPATGPAMTQAGELQRCMSSVYHDFYNNGFGNMDCAYKLGQWIYVRQYKDELDKIMGEDADAMVRVNQGIFFIFEHRDDMDEQPLWRQEQYKVHGADMEVVMTAVLRLAMRLHRQFTKRYAERQA